MNKLKCYVGLDNRFAMCEKFPNDEEHAGLNKMLEEFLDYDVYIQDKPLDQGFYNIEFDIEEIPDFTYDDNLDVYLVVKSLTKIDGFAMLKT